MPILSGFGLRVTPAKRIFEIITNVISATCVGTLRDGCDGGAVLRVERVRRALCPQVASGGGGGVGVAAASSGGAVLRVEGVRRALRPQVAQLN